MTNRWEQVEGAQLWWQYLRYIPGISLTDHDDDPDCESVVITPKEYEPLRQFLSSLEAPK